MLLSMAVGQELVQLAAPLWAQTLRRAAPGLSGNKTNDNSHQVAESLPAPKTRLCLQHSGYHNHSSVCCQIFSSDFACFLKTLWMSGPDDVSEIVNCDQNVKINSLPLVCPAM